MQSIYVLLLHLRFCCLGNLHTQAFCDARVMTAFCLELTGTFT